MAKGEAREEFEEFMARLFSQAMQDPIVIRAVSEAIVRIAVDLRREELEKAAGEGK